MAFSTLVRHASTSKGPQVIYQGPLATVARRLKLFSISSLGLSAGMSPLIYVIDVPIPMVARTVLVGAALFTSMASTGLIHWVMSPYVSKMTADDASKPETINLHTYSMTARELVTTVPVSALQPSTRIFTSWMVSDPSRAKGMLAKSGKAMKPKHMFYVHPELCQEDPLKSLVNRIETQATHKEDNSFTQHL
ncbi:hypothetical protein BZG36_00839 [Bifiguratus adelaidae]|uniref:Uncharacterized protein n=1 Tax=Bifiguratus adelaidae TaxID=1938954 RepID=A0A261Y6J7_9FUNG|nr:hypothetical protein BZG36_00839 [Bifiguratus adelaidae]